MFCDHSDAVGNAAFDKNKIGRLCNLCRNMADAGAAWYLFWLGHGGYAYELYGVPEIHGRAGRFIEPSCLGADSCSCRLRCAGAFKTLEFLLSAGNCMGVDGD